MKFRIGFIANSSASSFLVTDKSLDLETVKKRFVEAFGYIPYSEFNVINKKFMTDQRNNHHDLPFLRPLLRPC